VIKDDVGGAATMPNANIHYAPRMRSQMCPNCSSWMDESYYSDDHTTLRYRCGTMIMVNNEIVYSWRCRQNVVEGLKDEPVLKDIYEP
jgi:hypothetical protein